MSAEPTGISFAPLALPAEREGLVDWLTSDTWPFHGYPSVSRDRAVAWVQEGRFSSDAVESFWVLERGARIGLIRLFDLDDAADDGSPMLDLRLRTEHRGRGVGRVAVRWLTRHLFERYPALRRIEGATRSDNVAMRRVFLACGYVLEGRHRRSWPAADGSRIDAVHYAILREDWASGSTTPVAWDDEPTGIA